MQRIQEKVVYLMITQWMLAYWMQSTNASTLTISSPSNCGEDTKLNCTDDNLFSFWAIKHNGKNVLTDVSSNPKYSSSLTGNTLVVTIHNTNSNDTGNYTCTNGYNQPSQGVSLRFECKVTTAAVKVLNTKKLNLQMDKVYPEHITPTVSVEGGRSLSVLGGTHTCKTSSNFDGYFSCTWTSDSSLADGQYTFSAVIITLTANTVTGTFRIVSPTAPTFSNTVTENNQDVLRGDVGSPFDVHCLSSGGYPIQTVVLYFAGIKRNSSSIGILQNELFNVDVTYTFTPARTDDLKTFCCNSSYPNADSNYQGKRGICIPLWLNFPPSQVSVSQVANVVSGTTISVRCTASGSRPAANLTWTYKGTSPSPQVTTNLDSTTNTYTAISTFTRIVTKEDNGHTIQCSASHDALATAISRTAVLDVRFSPLSIKVTGNSNGFHADGTDVLTLTCKAGSSNPSPTIVWHNGTLGDDVIANSLPYVDTTGQFNGIVREQMLRLNPTRYNDGQSVTCSANNNIGNEMSTTINLNLQYSAIVSSMSDRTLIEGDTNISLTCQAWSKPAATFSWFKEGSTIPLYQVNGTLVNNSGTYVIPVVSRQHTGRYECRGENGVGNADAKQVNLTVQFGAQKTNITGSADIYANGINRVTLTCNTGSSNPSSNITWYRNSQQVTSSKPLTITAGDFGGKITSQILEFVPLREMDGHVIECRAGNGFQSSTVVWARIALDLKYDPIVSVTAESVEIDETQPGSLSCTVNSKPLSTITWTRVDSASSVPTNSFSRGNNSLEFQIKNAKREDAGQYQCTANNNHGGNKHNNTHIVVRYAPDVIVVTQNTTVNASSVDVQCNPSGVPATYKYTSWEQVWPGYGLVRTFPGSAVLTLTRLTYADSGVYTCKVENGVPYSRNPSAGQGQDLLNILSHPIIASAETTKNVAVQIGNVSKMSVEFFSNTQEATVYIIKNNSESKSDVALTEILPKKVTLRVFNHSIEVEGFDARTMLNVTKEDELGSYNFFIQNSIGIRSIPLKLNPEGPPCAPTIISASNVQQTSVVLTWSRGFHGGFTQTVYINISLDSRHWDVKLKLNEGKNEDRSEVNTNLQRLQPGTLYFIRMYAENERGESGPTRILNITLLNKDEIVPPSNLPLIVGGSIGGLAAAAVALLAVILVIKRWRSKSLGQRDDSSMLTNRHNLRSIPGTKSESDDEDDEVINPIYDGQDNIISKLQSADNLFSQPNKPKHNRPAAGPSDIYAVVNKEKKGREKAKKGNATDQDIYENSQTSFQKDKRSTNTKQTKNVNQDGLVYADVVFANPPKGQKRLVIHGIDDMTEYAQVDLTKRADPLPDSEDENDSSKI